MNCASNQLLSRSGLSQNQDRGIRRSYLRNLDQHVAQWLRGTDDFLEHGRAYDVFPQRNVFVSCPVFGALAVIDIGSSYIPAHQTSLFVAERVVTEEEPAILTVLPAHSLLDFKRLAASQPSFAIFERLLEIFRMVDSGAKVRGKYILHGEAGMVEHCLVRVKRLAIRVQDDNGLRYSIGNPAKLPLLLKEFLLRPFSIFDVGIASKPPDDVASSVELWNDAYEEPTVLSVISPDASFQFAWFGIIQQGQPFTNEMIQVIGVNDHLPTQPFPCSRDRPVYSYQRLFRYSLDPSGKLVHKKDGTVSMTVWSRAASWLSLSRASLRSRLSAFWASSLMFAQFYGESRQC